jgi:hypothetical protein
MVAGLNVTFSVWRNNYSPDDVIGGAVVTGTYIYNSVRGRFQQQPEEQFFIQQGLETVKSFSCIVAPATLQIRERDELVVVCPPNHYYYGDHFRVINARPADFVPNDRRNYLMLTLTRSVDAHANQ